MTGDRRTRRGRLERSGRQEPPGRLFVARRATFSLVVFSILLTTAVGAVLAMRR